MSVKYLINYTNEACLILLSKIGLQLILVISLSIRKIFTLHNSRLIMAAKNIQNILQANLKFQELLAN